MDSEPKAHSWAQDPEPEPQLTHAHYEAEVIELEEQLGNLMRDLATPTATRGPVNVNLSGLAFDVLIETLFPPGSGANLDYRRTVAERGLAFLASIEEDIAAEQARAALMAPATLPGMPPGVSGLHRL